MSDLILIEPKRTVLADELTVLEIHLGGTPRGMIVLLVDDATPQIESVEAMNTLAVEGFESLAVRAGDGVADPALDRAAARGWEHEQVGVVGIGEGATAALDLARGRRLGAVVSLSPVPDVDAVASDPALLTPWLGLFGDEQDQVSPTALRRLRHVLEEGSDVYSQVVAYPGVGVDFHRCSDDGISFAASYDGWQRTVEWLLARVATRPTPLAIAWRERQATDG